MRGELRNGRVLQFGAFELKTGTGEIRKHGVRIRLQGKPLHLLEALLQRPGDVVTREELHSLLWAADTFVDFESGLNTAVNRLRLALGDSADSPRFIETLARSGYRFIAPVSESLPPEHNEHEVAVVAPAPEKQPEALPIPLPVVPSAPRLRSVNFWIAAVAAVISISAVSLFLIFEPKSAPPVFHQITFRRTVIQAARFGADGHSVIYDGTEKPDSQQLYLADTVSPESRPLGFAHTALASVSRSGELALIQMGGERSRRSLIRVPVNGGAPLPIDEAIWGADWAPDHTRMAVIRATQESMRIEYPRGKPIYQSVGWLSDVRVSPSGNEVAFIYHPVRGDDGGSIMTVDVAGKYRTISSGWASADGLAWAPSGREVWFTAAHSGLTRALYAASLSGNVRTIAAFPGTLTLCDISSSGRVLISLNQPHAMMTSLTDNAPNGQDLSWFDYTNVVDISADGRIVLFEETGEGGGSHHAVYVRRANESAAVRVGEGFASAISPDGRWVIIMPDDDQTSLRLVPLSPSQPRTISGHGLKYDFVRFFPSGDRLLASGTIGNGPLRLYVQSLNGEAPVPLSTDEYIMRPAISSDAQQIAGVDTEHRLVTLNVSTGQTRIVASDFVYTILAWGHDGKSLLAQGETVPTMLFRVDVSNGRYKPWKQIVPYDLVGVSYLWPAVLSRDEHTIVYSYQRNLSELFIVDGWH